MMRLLVAATVAAVLGGVPGASSPAEASDIAACGGFAPVVVACSTAPVTWDWHVVAGFDFPSCAATLTPMGAPLPRPCFAGLLEQRLTWDGGEFVLRCQVVRYQSGPSPLDACTSEGSLSYAGPMEHSCTAYGAGEWRCRVYRWFG